MGSVEAKIRRGENSLYRVAYDAAKRILRVNVPPVKVIFIPVYHARRLVLGVLRYALQKVFYEPMFKVKCSACGKGLRILHGLPLVSSHLRLSIGENVTINGINSFAATSVFDEPVIEIGDGTSIGYECIISVGKRVSIGKNCMLADRVFIADNDGHPLDPKRRQEKVRAEEIRPVELGDNVWVGYQVFIGKGVTIGNGAMIGANSVVIRDVPAYHVVAGNPARVMRIFKPDEEKEDCFDLR